ncbi:MAG: ABC transporter ATP-binding protein [Fidelibacterota bacterium]
MNHLVELKNVNKRFGSTKALDDISLKIPGGRIVGLVGPNGAGKTTMLRALTGLISYDGEISILGVEPKKDRPKLMEKTGVIHDIPVLPPWMTVNQVLKFQENIHPGFHLSQCEKMLESTEITFNKKIKHLSKGMKTQLHLAIVLSSDTQLLILDEPTHGLDILFRKRLYSSVLEDYFDETKSVLISTHQVEEVEHILTDVIFINHGKIILYESMERLSEKYVLLTVADAEAEKVRKMNPLTENYLLGKRTFLLDTPDRKIIEELGKVSPPTVVDIFMAIMGGAE